MLRKFKPPHPFETREAIEDMDEKTSEDLIYKNAFKYAYLIAGRLVEIVGKYAPVGSDAFNITIGPENAVLFRVKTARWGERYRPIALPLNKKYEEWSKTLLDWFDEHGTANPFDLGKSIETTRRNFQWKADEVFKGHEWIVERYTKTIYEKVSKERIVKENFVNGNVLYLIELDNGERRWVNNLKIKKATEVIPRHWDNFSLQHLRYQRITELKNDFNFIDEQVKTYAGLGQTPTSRTSELLTQSYQAPTIAPQLDNLISIAQTYFAKLTQKLR